MTDLRAVPLLEDLLAHPSPTGDVDAARRALRRRLEAAGLEAWTDEAGNLRARAGAGHRRVVLCGHVDTVPGGPIPHREDGTLWGRGAVDAKGPLAVLAATLGALRDHPDLDLRFCAVPDEEGPSTGARHLARDLDGAEAVVVGEPNRARGYALGYRGRLALEAQARIEARHPAGPEPTAPDRLHAWWADVRAACDEASPDADGLFRRTSPNLLATETSRRPDADEARLEAGIRLPPGLGPDELLDRLPPAPDGVTVDVVAREAPVEADPRNPVAGALRAAIRGGGRQPRPAYKTGTCDLNVLAPALEAPGLAYGPGDPALDHAPDERVAVQEVQAAASILPDALRALPERLRRAAEAPPADTV